MGTVVGAWRLKAIVLLFIVLFSIYFCYGLLSDINVYDYGINETSGYNISENNTTQGLQTSQGFWDIVLGFGNFLSFGKISNTWARMIINIFVSTCWIMIGYIGYTFVKEWIPFT